MAEQHAGRLLYRGQAPRAGICSSSARLRPGTEAPSLPPLGACPRRPGQDAPPARPGPPHLPRAGLQMCQLPPGPRPPAGSRSLRASPPLVSDCSCSGTFPLLALKALVVCFLGFFCGLICIRSNIQQKNGGRREAPRVSLSLEFPLLR